jgi:hypothetical protein
MMKGIEDIRWVTTPTRQRLVTSRKRTLRRRSERAARSVWSGHQSRVSQSRKKHSSGSSCLSQGGQNYADCYDCGGMAGPGSWSGAEVRVDIPGTCEGLPLLDQRYRNGMIPDEQRPGVRKVVSPSETAKQETRSRYRRSSLRQERRDGETAGRLSRLIVAIESWETLSGRSQ